MKPPRTNGSTARPRVRRRDDRADKALRRSRCRRRRRPARSARLRLWLSRTERRRQDDADPDAARADRREGRDDAAARAAGPAERAEALARVGAIVEEPRFHRHLTGRENLEIIAAAREPEAHARIDGALARVGLAERADERVKRYSLGMRQRLGVARSLLGDPELLILDEPTNGLDPAGIHEFRAMIRGFVAEGRTVLLSSHLLSEVEKICDEVAIVDRGRVVMQGAIAELAARRQQSVLVATSDDEAGARDGVRAGRGRIGDTRPGRDSHHPRQGRSKPTGGRRDQPQRRSCRACHPSLRAENRRRSSSVLEITSRLEEAA